MDKPSQPIDEHADLDPSQLAALNPESHDNKPATPAAPDAPALSAHKGHPVGATAEAVAQTSPVVTKAPEPLKAPEPPKQPPAPPKPAPTIPATPAPPPPAPDPVPEKIAVDAPAQAGPVATAPIFVYDADLDQHTTSKAEVRPPVQPAPAKPADAEAKPESGHSPEPQKPQQMPAPPPPPRKVKPVKPKSVKSDQAIKVYSQSQRHVWQAQRSGQRYKVFVVIFLLMILAVAIFAWMALGSPTNLESLNSLNT